MNVLVTGSSGFIGGAICRELVSRGERVRAFHRPGSNTLLLDDLPVEHHIGDLNDPSSLLNPMKGVSVVIHCAAQMGNTTDWKHFFNVTVRGTQAVLDIAREEKVKRFIHTSSVAALGVPEPGIKGSDASLLSETHTWNYSPKLWQYGYAKYLAEMEVQRAVALGLDAVIVNPTSVFGGGDVLRNESSVIRLVADRGLNLCAQGGMNVVHIHDVVVGHLSALEHGLRGERYIIGGENISHAAFFHTILSLTGKSRRLIILPPPLVKLVRRLFFITSRLLHLDINPGILNLAGYYFYYDLEKSQRQLRLSTPLDAKQAVIDASQWFKEHTLP
ncbi:MAG: NAD-dependent epimerase/dehydratase family protein [Anaerolineaceae bacterium]|nr:NAD-dependent epimerase/dehydratase family protein [Anaerolineaceae bacterium]